MNEASRAVLDGFELRTDVRVVKYPDRFMDDRGAVMWQRVMQLLARCQQSEGAA
jgi:DNA polymerase I